MLNNIPEDADFVTFDFRQDEDNEKIIKIKNMY